MGVIIIQIVNLKLCELSVEISSRHRCSLNANSTDVRLFNLYFIIEPKRNNNY